MMIDVARRPVCHPFGVPVMKCLAPLAWALPLLVVAGLVQADPPDESDPAGTSAEAGKLQGTWRVVKLIRDGQTIEADDFDDMRLVIDEDEYTFKNQQGQRRVGTIKVLASRKPAVLETTYAEPPGEGKTVRRIYRWTGKNTIELCSPGPDERVPDKFAAPTGSGRELATWQRVDK